MTTWSSAQGLSSCGGPPLAAPVRSACVAPEPRSLQVLLVEDDEADAYLVKRALGTNPQVGQVIHARDGVEALELIDRRQIRPDLAIIDLNMPRKGGFALLSELDARVVVEFPSIVLTSSRSTADAQRAGRCGSTHFLTKPAGLDSLTAALDRIIAAV